MTFSMAELHLMLNHIPILGTGFALLVVLWGLFRRSNDVLLTGLGFAVAVAAVTYPIFLTGHEAEEQLEDETWFSDKRVHEHEERAEAALVATLITGVVALVTLWLTRGGKPPKTLLVGASVAGLLVAVGLFAWTALAGGQIRHEEVRSGAPPPATSEAHED